MGNIEPSDTSIDGSMTQESNLYLLCIEKVGIRSVLGEIVAVLDPSKQVNLTNSVHIESPNFKSLGLPAVDATDIRNLNVSPPYQSKELERNAEG